MFKRLFYTGSSYEGLRIREADEFDINLVLKLPVQGDEFQLVAEKPGHVSYTLTKGCRGRILDSMEGPLVQSFFGLFSRQLKFQPQLLRTWFQGVMDKALRAYTPPSGDDGSRLFEVRLSQSGPAKTLYVHLSGGGRIDIDLVPVLEHSYDQLPADVPRQEWVKELPELDKMWFMVPKNPEDNEDLWRIHFPTAEKKFIKDFKCLKPTIRLIKALRDRHSWKLLSSYSIKTVVMRHRLEKPQPSYWLKDNQWTVLLEVLERLQMELLADGPGICSLFDKNVSLIQGLGVETRKNIAARLKRIVNILTKYPERTLEFFLEPSPSVPSESSPTGDEVMIRQLSGLSLLASDVSFGEISTDCGVDSRDSSFANGALDVSLGNQVCVLADRTQEAGIIVSQKLELLGENVGAAPIQVTLSVLLSDGRLLGETSTTLHSCPDQTVAVPLGRLTGLTAVSLLVVRLCFEAAGQTASAPKDVTSVLSVMTAGGRQLVNSRFHIRVCNRVQQCELRLPFPQVE
ncbi:hypothetical protein V5799_018206 [Amblyomma americanum]|uniref:Uncharacterized protein n=1 Tax=Amblyomma americanum TaxID=6943 RepID=A0AAQ4F112_AMBAM